MQGPAAPQQPLPPLEWPGDVRDLVASALSWWWFVAALLLGAVLFVRTRRQPRTVAVVALEPTQPAATALAALRALELPSEPEHLVPFHERVKALVRLHCRERFGAPAEMQTSEELLAVVPAGEHLQACLRACDCVLFAAVRPGPDSVRRCRELAIEFAVATAAGVP